MRKLTAILLAVILTFTLAACGASESPEPNKPENTQPEAQTQPETKPDEPKQILYIEGTEFPYPDSVTSIRCHAEEIQNRRGTSTDFDDWIVIYYSTYEEQLQAHDEYEAYILENYNGMTDSLGNTMIISQAGSSEYFGFGIKYAGSVSLIGNDTLGYFSLGDYEDLLMCTKNTEGVIELLSTDDDSLVSVVLQYFDFGDKAPGIENASDSLREIFDWVGCQDVVEEKITLDRQVAFKISGIKYNDYTGKDRFHTAYVFTNAAGDYVEFYIVAPDGFTQEDGSDFHPDNEEINKTIVNTYTRSRP